MTAAAKLAGAVISAFLLAGTAAEAAPPAQPNATPTGQQPDKECKKVKDLTAFDQRQLARGTDIGLCKGETKPEKPAPAAPKPGTATKTPTTPVITPKP